MVNPSVAGYWGLLLSLSSCTVHSGGSSLITYKSLLFLYSLMTARGHHRAATVSDKPHKDAGGR